MPLKGIWNLAGAHHNPEASLFPPDEPSCSERGPTEEGFRMPNNNICSQAYVPVHFLVMIIPGTCPGKADEFRSGLSILFWDIMEVMGKISANGIRTMRIGEAMDGSLEEIAEHMDCFTRAELKVLI
ncbi:hypothetical protein MLD38_006597 [Melastoma candidum]|uniref:Uncharacterized protein n=1 Tax=Melastoma candidum TaxID=119954 RepID=A0ACB9RMM2_9MYRT|nr:hypothetical protein MLD38_006597 [Melastoma candidum]